VTDADSANLVGATVTISGNFASGQDVLRSEERRVGKDSNNAGTGVLTMRGTATVANYQAALQSVTYFNSSDNHSTATRTVGFQVNDGGSANNLSNTATKQVTVTAVNDAPVVTTSAGALAYTENQAATAVDPALTVTDADSANLVGATVTISGNFASGQDVL